MFEGCGRCSDPPSPTTGEGSAAAPTSSRLHTPPDSRGCVGAPGADPALEALSGADVRPAVATDQDETDAAAIVDQCTADPTVAVNQTAAVEQDVLDRLAALPAGAVLAELVERLVSTVLAPVAQDGDGAAAGSPEAAPLAPGGIDVLAVLGADALSELVAATGRLASWAAWAQAILAAALERTPEMSPDPSSRAAGDRPVHLVTPQESAFTTSSEIACRLGVSRRRATRLLELGRALAAPCLAATGAAHQAGLIDTAKATLITTRLAGVEDEVAHAVQDQVLPRAARRTHAQLARDVDRALAALDPEGTEQRRRRDTAARHVTRPRPAGHGVHEMRLVLPSPDSFLLDATLDAVAASARATGDERTSSQLRADAVVAMAINTLRGAQHAAHHAPADAPGDAPATRHGPADLPDTSTRPAPEGTRLMPDGVPLEGMLIALSRLVGSTSPWWMPSGAPPVGFPPGLTVNVDVTVPLDHLTSALHDPSVGAPADTSDAPPARPPDVGAPGWTEGRPPDLMSLHALPGSEGTVDHHLGEVWAGSDRTRPETPCAAAPAGASMTVGSRSTPVPAAVARALAAGGTWRRVVTDPLTGVVLDVGRTRYRPPAALADMVRTRDTSCTHPGCTTPATSCELDHITPWAAGGTTSLDNLTTLCQTHHRLKHTPGWVLTRAEDGTLTWRTPTGARYQRHPDGTITILARRTGPRHHLQPAGPAPEHLVQAVNSAVLQRLNRGLTHYPTRPASRAGGPAITTRGPRPGERAGAFEPVPYPQALHDLGLAPLLDAIPPF